MIEIGLGHYLSLGAIIFFLGVIGIFLNRKNVIVILMSIELMLNAVNINIIGFASYGNFASPFSSFGQVLIVFVITIAAAELALAIAIILRLYRNKNTVNVDEIDILKG